MFGFWLACGGAHGQGGIASECLAHLAVRERQTTRLESIVRVTAFHRSVFAAFLFVLGTWTTLFSQPAVGQNEADSARKQAAALLQHAKQVMRFARADQSVIHLHSLAAATQDYQSDRTYPPFFDAMQVQEEWFDPQTGVDRMSTQTTFPGGAGPAQVVLDDATHAFRAAGEKLAPLPASSLQTRYLNPWAVIHDWAADGDARVVGHETYRDYDRVVLARATSGGEHRLLIDAKSGFPVKLEMQERHYLWGQQHIEYVYSTWILGGGVMVPGASFRLADGRVDISQTTGDIEMIARAAAPSMALPEGQPPAADTLPLFLQPLDLKTEQVGPETYLLSNPGYREAVTEIGGEVFLFDGTQGEERAKKDLEAINKLFPGRKKLTVVVTDLAWPHVAGLRYWVANDATIMAHKAARDFLQSVVDRRWTLAPDLLEQRRGTAKMKFIGVDAAFPLAGGALSLYPIDGIGSEVALMGYLTADRFLWASDYIQTVAEPSSYLSEVWRAVQREGLRPERTAAEHLPLTPWATIEELHTKDESPLH